MQRLKFGSCLCWRVKQAAQFWIKVLQSPAVRQVCLGKERLQVSELKSLSLAKRRCESLFLELFILVSGVVWVDAYHSNLKAVTRPGLKRQQSPCNRLTDKKYSQAVAGLVLAQSDRWRLDIRGIEPGDTAALSRALRATTALKSLNKLTIKKDEKQNFRFLIQKTRCLSKYRAIAISLPSVFAF